MIWKCVFEGRRVDGIVKMHMAVINAKDPEEARNKLYDKFEHIAYFNCEFIPDHSYSLWECDNGNCWSTCNCGICADDHVDGGMCFFSGCKEGDHRLHLRKCDANMEEASDWFRNVNQDN